jgi:Family of unknown function (DUF6176)/Transcription factor WhiB
MMPGHADSLPGSIEDFMARPAWRRDALCRGQGHSAFICGPKADYSTARKLCAVCPVQDECLQAALADSDLVGLGRVNGGGAVGDAAAGGMRAGQRVSAIMVTTAVRAQRHAMLNVPIPGGLWMPQTAGSRSLATPSKEACKALSILRVAIRRINPGRADELREWLAEANGPRREEALAPLVDEGCTHEQAYLIEGVEGPVVIYVMEVEDNEESQEAARSSRHPIDAHHKRVMEQAGGGTNCLPSFFSTFVVTRLSQYAGTEALPIRRLLWQPRTESCNP